MHVAIAVRSVSANEVAVSVIPTSVSTTAHIFTDRSIAERMFFCYYKTTSENLQGFFEQLFVSPFLLAI